MNINTPAPALPVDSEIALHLATLAHHLPSSDAPSRQSLCHIADLLHGVHPNTEAALSAALRGAADATSRDPLAMQPDVWLLRACARLLGAGASASAVAAPVGGEEVAMVRQVAAFLEKNGDAQFTYIHRAMDDHKANAPLRVGFKRMIDAEGNALKINAATDCVNGKSALDESSEQRAALVEYMIFPEAFRRDVCRGFDAGAVAEVLRKRGHLVHQKDRLTSRQRLPGMGSVPCYHVKPSIFADEV